MKAEIIGIGTELLLGEILNTNTQYISKNLADLGIDVYYHTVVGDNPKRLEECFESAFKKVDLVITTGGLGPTQDDLSKNVAAKYFKKKTCAGINASKDHIVKNVEPANIPIPVQNK